MTVIKLNCSKIPKDKLFQGKSGKLIDLVLVPNFDGPDQYGNDGAVCVSQSREEREAKEKRIYVGNYKEIGGKPAQPQGGQRSMPPTQRQAAPQKPADPDLDPESDDIGF